MTVSSIALYGDYRLSVIVTDPPWYENCFIVQHLPSGEQIIVDPGSNAERILAAVEANGGPVREILLTHGHPDHLGAVAALQRSLGLTCRAHEAEATMVARIADYARDRLGMEVEPPQSFHTFNGETDLELGGKPFRVISTPGHTPGGVCYAFEGFALTGDTLFNHGVGRTDLPGGDGRLLMNSITHLLETLPGETLLYCGHGPRWSVAEARPWWAAMRGWDTVL